jgi:hypothetical protein
MRGYQSSEGNTFLLNFCLEGINFNSVVAKLAKLFV